MRRFAPLSRKPKGLAPLPTSWVAFAHRICLSSLAIPPRAGRARAALRKCDERSSAGRRICVICVFFFLPTHLPLTHLQCPEKTTKYVRHITSKKGLDRYSHIFPQNLLPKVLCSGKICVPVQKEQSTPSETACDCQVPGMGNLR